jgi:Helix-turn-helix domain
MGSKSDSAPSTDNNSVPDLSDNCRQPQPSSCPLLLQLLTEKGLTPLGIYTVKDAAKIFGTTPRTIQDWIRCEKLPARDLPRGGRFLSIDLELFLRGSLKQRHGGGR